MKLSPVSFNNPNFKARWSEKTLDLAKEIDKQKGTKLRKELEEALDKNPELKKYGRDNVILSLGSKQSDDLQCHTFNITQDFNGCVITAPITPIDCYDRYYDEFFGKRGGIMVNGLESILFQKKGF